MADTVSHDVRADEYREYIDEPKILQEKIVTLAKMIREHAGNVIVFTGAGISTATGIPDFRSGVGSVTGMPAGKWCSDATSEQWTAETKKEERRRRKNTTSALNAIPSQSHMALVALEERGILAGLVSQNCDGLHRRSGFNPKKLAELHGNTNLEYCGWCGKEYFRDFSTYQGRHQEGPKLRKLLWSTHRKLKLINPRNGTHYTGRRCLVKKCEGYLFDSTVDFGDNLPEKHIERGFDLGERATLCIVLGSRCSVSPACDIPIGVGKRGDKLVIVNLQRTQADNYASLRIGAKIDDVMNPLMKELGIPIPRFLVRRNIRVENDGKNVIVRTVGPDGLPDDALWNVQTAVASTNIVAENDVSRVTSDDIVAPAKSVRVVLNKDAGTSKFDTDAPVPGDEGVVLNFPWDNIDRPGMAEVRFLSGTQRGEVFSVSPSVCTVTRCVHTGSHSKRADGTVQKWTRVVNSGSLVSSDLLRHKIPIHSKTLPRNVTLMFRAHYGETPLSLPIPSKAGESFSKRFAFDPVRRLWCEVADKTTGVAIVANLRESEEDEGVEKTGE